MDCCKIGTYECQEFAYSCEFCGHSVYVDRCLLDEIRHLKDKGVHTLGCCCGHGYDNIGYIQVTPDDVETMLRLGYEQKQVENGMGYWCFKPKSILREGA